MSRSRASVASTLLLAAALAGVAFGAAAGTELTRTSVVEVLVVLGGGLVVSAGVLWGPPDRLHGATALIAFAALAALTALSILWSIAPELSYVEAGRTLAYLAVFGAAVVAARLRPGASAPALKGIVLAAIAAVAYSLAARVWPGTLAEDELSNRIGQPFQYWNAVGTTAALATPGLLWLGSRRTGSALGRALAYPAFGLCVLAILLTGSRGALIAGALGALGWFALVPLRLRSLPVLVVPSAAAAALGAWALSKDAFSRTLQPLEAKEAVAGDFGLLLALLVVALLLAGLAVNAGLARATPTMRLRRRAGAVALAAGLAVPLVAFTSVAMSDRGLGGTIEDRVDELTSETDTAPVQGAGRLAEASSTRGKYWREADRVFDDRPVAGVGAGAFAVARLRHRTDAASSRHAHGYVSQTLADLGLLGLGASLALLAAWLAAAARATGLGPRRLPFRRPPGPPPRRDWTTERTTLVALSLVAIVFGLQSAIDWTWFVPGPAAMALVAAGFVAGRGPLVAPAPEGVARPAGGSRPGRPGRARVLAAAAVACVAGLAGWAVWQPERSDRAVSRALELVDEGDLEGALAETESAEDANPLSPNPLLVRASVANRAGSRSDAERALERAVLRFPGDPQTWLALATFQLETLERPEAALATLRGALYLDPFSPAARGRYLEASAAARAQAGETPRP